MKRRVALVVVLCLGVILALGVLGALLTPAAYAGRGPKVECTQYLGTNRGTSGEWYYCGGHDNTNVTVLTLGVPEGCPEGTQGYIQHVECSLDGTCDPKHPWHGTVWAECWAGCEITEPTPTPTPDTSLSKVSVSIIAGPNEWLELRSPDGLHQFFQPFRAGPDGSFALFDAKIDDFGFRVFNPAHGISVLIDRSQRYWQVDLHPEHGCRNCVR